MSHDNDQKRKYYLKKLACIVILFRKYQHFIKDGLKNHNTAGDLDDFIMTGSETEIRKASETLTISETNCSLELRKDKCELWSIEIINKTDSRIKKKSVKRFQFQELL